MDDKRQTGKEQTLQYINTSIHQHFNTSTHSTMFTLLIEFGTPAYDDTVRLRDDILRKPLELEFTPEYLAKEYSMMHLACYNDRHELLGCLILMPLDDGEIKMQQVAVREDCQRKGVGQLLVADSEAISKARGFKKMVLHARDTAIPFYLKLKYKKKGRAFTEVTVKHYKMEKTL